MGWSAFRPLGPTIAISVTTGASTPVQAPPGPGEGQATNYLISNTTTQPVFLGYGVNAAQATAGATTAGTGQCLFLGPNASQPFTFGRGTFFATIAATGTSIVMITPGDGL